MGNKPNSKFFMLLTIAMAVVGGGLVYWQSSKANDAADRVGKLQAEARDQGQLQKELTDAEDNLKVVSGRLAHLEKSVPQMAYVPTLLKELEQTGKEYGITVLGVRPIPAKESSKSKGSKEKVVRKAYNELDIEVRGKGAYDDINRFMAGLQNFPKVLAARTVSLMPRNDPQAAGAAPSLDATFVIRAYLFDPETKPAAEGSGEKTIDLSSRKKNTEPSTYEG